MTGEEAHDALQDGRRSPAKARTRAILTPGAHPALEAEERARRAAAYTAALEVANWDFEVEGHRIELLHAQEKALSAIGDSTAHIWQQIQAAQARKSAAMQIIKALRKGLTKP